jgi:hypothetical protein
LDAAVARADASRAFSRAARREMKMPFCWETLRDSSMFGAATVTSGMSIVIVLVSRFQRYERAFRLERSTK